MYIIKVRFNEREQCPEYYAIDSALFGEPEWHVARLEVECLGRKMTYSTFDLQDAKAVAQQALSGMDSNMRYAYTDGFMPGATFVFEYDR